MNPAPVPHDRPDPALLRPRPRVVYVEMTSRCNVRCVYCPVSHPGYEGQDSVVDFEALADQIQRHHPGEVHLNGHGETTMLDDWTRTGRALLERGLPVTITTNMAKRFSDEEIELLSRFRAIDLSCDTCDAKLLGQLRRGVRLDHIEDNLARIRQACRAGYRDEPYLQASCTLTDVAVPGLPALVRWAAAQGVHAVGLVNLVRHPDLPGAIPVRHPVEVDPQGTREKIEEARAVAAGLGVVFHVEPGLADALEVALACR